MSEFNFEYFKAAKGTRYSGGFHSYVIKFWDGAALRKAAEMENYVGSNFSASDAQGYIIMTRNLDLLLNTSPVI